MQRWSRPSFLAILLALAFAACDSPVDQEPVRYVARILLDSTIVDPARGTRCQTLHFRAVTEPRYNGPRFAWSTSSPNVVEVSGVGEAILQNAGEAVVQAVLTQDTSVRAFQRVHVEVPPGVFHGEFTVVRGQDAWPLQGYTARDEGQLYFTYAVAPQYANASLEIDRDGVLVFRSPLVPGSDQRCVPTLITVRWQPANFGAGVHRYTARLIGANNQQVSSISASFTVAAGAQQ